MLRTGRISGMIVTRPHSRREGEYSIAVSFEEPGVLTSDVCAWFEEKLEVTEVDSDRDMCHCIRQLAGLQTDACGDMDPRLRGLTEAQPGNEGLRYWRERLQALYRGVQAAVERERERPILDCYGALARVGALGNKGVSTLRRRGAIGSSADEEAISDQVVGLAHAHQQRNVDRLLDAHATFAMGCLSLPYVDPMAMEPYMYGHTHGNFLRMHAGAQMVSEDRAFN